MLKILVFTEGTILMHKSAAGHSRIEIVKQVQNEEKSIFDYGSYVPIRNALHKLQNWKNQGAEIMYLTSRTKPKEIHDIENVLRKYDFPLGQLLYRNKSQSYQDIVEKISPDVLIEDDCESIGGEKEKEMTITHVKPAIKAKIKSISVKEFGGINDLSESILELIS